MNRNLNAKTAMYATSGPMTTPKRKLQPTVLNFMDGSRTTANTNSKYNKYPCDIFDLLRRAINERRRIEVLTRDCRGVHGILIGWLIVFDKHMNLIMSDVDEVFQRLTDGQDYLELGPQRQMSCLHKFDQSLSASTQVTNDFETFRVQLAKFLSSKKKQPVIARPSKWAFTDEDENSDENEEHQKICECHPEEFSTMELLSVDNITVQRLNSKIKHFETPAQLHTTKKMVTSTRPKVRFFSRSIPKLFIKGNQVCLIRLLPS